jgi:hypothetical protein
MGDSDDPLFLHSEDTLGERGLRAIGPWDEVAQAEMERRMNTPERRALATTLQEIVRRGEPAYAVADEDLGAGAVAIVVRDDPDGGLLSRLIVFGTPTLSDEVVACARGALMQSEVAEPHLSRRRVITLWLDGRYEVREEERQAAGRREWQGPSRPTGAADRLRASAELAPIVSIPDVGAVRLIVPAAPGAEPTPPI